ncbi:hypothetical protein ACQSSU_13025 [Micromonospora echinospora]
MAEREPKRIRKPFSTSPDVFKSAGRHGFTGSAKSGRTWNVSEHRPASHSRSTTRKDGAR